MISLRGNPLFAWFSFASSHADSLNRAVRGHGNLTEYAPIFLILMLVGENMGFSQISLHCYGLPFLAGRLMHGVCFGFLHRSMLLRVGGTALTLFSLIGMSSALLVTYFK